jgi:dihydroxyacetone kinase-like predicted kinase
MNLSDIATLALYNLRRNTMRTILTSLGVDVVVSGGQTMNPSTADILLAIESCNADEVIVLPNNGNIRMAAEAAASACEGCKAYVVVTRSVLQAFAAMFVVDMELSAEENVTVMTEALEDVRDGEVTTAVRDSQAADGSPIHAGDVMGIEDGAITVVGSDVTDVTLRLIDRMQAADECDTLTILAGEDLSDDEFEAIQDAIADAQPDLEIDAHRGEQPLYPIIFSLE